MTTAGDASQPQDTRGEGPVTLEGRTEPGGQGSPDTNQGKAEPEATVEHEADPRAEREAPDLSSMNVGAADPQAPSHPAAGRQPSHPSHPSSESVSRAPSTDPAEHVGTDPSAGERAMQPGGTRPVPGESQGVAVPASQSAEGTSEQQTVVRGARP